MPYRMAGIDVHKKMPAVVVADVEVEDEYQFERCWYGSNPEQLRMLSEWLVEAPALSKQASSIARSIPSPLPRPASVALRAEYPKRLLVSNGTRDSFIDIGEIEWIEASDYYACLHVGARSFMLRETMKDLSRELDQNDSCASSAPPSSTLKKYKKFFVKVAVRGWL